MADYIKKPFQRNELLARINTQLQLRNAWKAQLHATMSDTLLQQILPLNIIRRLQSGAKMIADDHPHTSILFSDVVGFTTLASVLPTKQVCMPLPPPPSSNALRERGPLTREAVEKPLPSNHPRCDHVKPFQLNTIPYLCATCFGGPQRNHTRLPHDADATALTAGGAIAQSYVHIVRPAGGQARCVQGMSPPYLHIHHTVCSCLYQRRERSLRLPILWAKSSEFGPFR
jgi:hypothetical protein